MEDPPPEDCLSIDGVTLPRRTITYGGGGAGAPLVILHPGHRLPPAESIHANFSQIIQIGVLSVFCSLL